MRHWQKASKQLWRFEWDFNFLHGGLIELENLIVGAKLLLTVLSLAHWFWVLAKEPQSEPERILDYVQELCCFAVILHS